MRRAFVAALVLLVSACGPDRSSAQAPALAVASPARVKARRSPRAAADPGFVGVIVAGESAEIEASVEGRIEEVFVGPGDLVAQGAPIARLDRRAVGHELASARAALAEASRRLARRRKLARGKLAAVTVEEVDAARREVLQERARVARLAQQRAEAVVTAPFAGTIAERYLVAGALAGPGRPIVRLAGRGAPRVRFAVPEERAAAAAVGVMVDARIAPSGRTVRGRITGVASEVDVSSRMVFAAADLEPPAPPAAQPLTTGLLARVFLAVPGAGPDRGR